MFKCSSCEYSTNKKYNILRHYKRHTNNNKPQNTIDVPLDTSNNDIKTNDESTAIIHNNVSQTKICPYCGKELTSRTGFSRHFHHTCPKRKEINLQNQTQEQPKQILEESNPLAIKLLEAINSLVEEIREIKEILQSQNESK